MTAERSSAAQAGEGWIDVFAPATISNVGPGFDCFGFALEAPGDGVRARPVPTPGVRIVSIEGDAGRLPTDPEANTAAVAAAFVWSRFPEVAATTGLELAIEKGIPIGSGLGSSAASAAAGAFAAMQLIMRATGTECSADTTLEAALAGEMVASGARHADNVTPALLGGFTVVQSVDPLHVLRFEPRLAWRVAVALPDLSITTQASRHALPESVPLAGAVRNWSNAASLVLGLLSGDVDVVKRALRDELVEPHREATVPGCGAAKRAAQDAGAIGACLSGSGPAVFALATSQPLAEAAGEAMVDAFARHDLRARQYVGSISPTGARLR